MSGQVIDTRGQVRRGASPSVERPIRVVIADHDGLARSMLRRELVAADGIATVATAGTGREALELVRSYRPTVLIIDTALLSNGCMELIGRILSASPATRVVTISVDDDRTALAALRAGAIGHLSKDIDPKRLGRLVARAAAGEALVPRRLTLPLLELARQLPEAGWRPLAQPSHDSRVGNRRADQRWCFHAGHRRSPGALTDYGLQPRQEPRAQTRRPFKTRSRCRGVAAAPSRGVGGESERFYTSASGVCGVLDAPGWEGGRSYGSAGSPARKSGR